MQIKFRIPEIVLGALLAVAIFAMGFVFAASQYPATSTDNPRGNKTSNEKEKSGQSERTWITSDNLLALFTLGLVIVGGIQLRFFYVQLRLISQSLADAKEAAEGTTAAAKAATRQAKIAEDSLAKLERPYLFIFNVGRLKTEKLEDPEAEGSGDDILLSVTYSVANYGKIPAIIKHAQAGLSVAVNPISPNRLPYSHTLIVSPIFASGETRHKMVERFTWNGAYGNGEYEEIVPDFGKDNTLFFWIIIGYRGPFTDGHEIRMCWRYDEATGRFIGPHGDETYSKYT